MAAHLDVMNILFNRLIALRYTLIAAGQLVYEDNFVFLQDNKIQIQAHAGQGSPKLMILIHIDALHRLADDTTQLVGFMWAIAEMITAIIERRKYKERKLPKGWRRKIIAPDYNIVYTLMGIAVMHLTATAAYARRDTIDSNMVYMINNLQTSIDQVMAYALQRGLTYVNAQPIKIAQINQAAIDYFKLEK